MKAALRVLAVLVIIPTALLLGSCAWLMGFFGDDVDIGPVTWDKTAVEWSENTYSFYKVTLPPGGSANDIWGTDVYTNDSSIGTAAVHADLITFAAGGTVKIQILPGESSYEGSSRNGVVSQDFGEWGASFKFVDAND